MRADAFEIFNGDRSPRGGTDEQRDGFAGRGARERVRSSWRGARLLHRRSRIPSALAAKKHDLTRQGYPSRLVGLLDIGVQSVPRIETEPSGFRVIDVAADGSKTDVNWDDDEERIARDNLTSDRSVRYWIVNSRHAFSCAGLPPYDQQSDYIATDDLNSDAAITPQGGGVQCSR